MFLLQLFLSQNFNHLLMVNFTYNFTIILMLNPICFCCNYLFPFLWELDNLITDGLNKLPE